MNKGFSPSSQDVHGRASAKVLIADASEILRAALGSLCREKLPWMSMAGEAADGQRAVEMAHELTPRLVLMNVQMPVLNAIDAARLITAGGGTKVVIMGDRPNTAIALEAIRAGASAFVLLGDSLQEFCLAAQAAAEGRVFISSAITSGLIEACLPRQATGDGNEVAAHASSAFRALTARQRQVLKLLAEGATTKDLAKQLNISARTIETHRCALMNKLNLHTTAELTKYAVREGLTNL